MMLGRLSLFAAVAALVMPIQASAGGLGDQIKTARAALLAAAETTRSDCNSDSNDDCTENLDPSIWYHPSGRITQGSFISGNFHGNTPGKQGPNAGDPGTAPSSAPGPSTVGGGFFSIGNLLGPCGGTAGLTLERVRIDGTHSRHG